MMAISPSVACQMPAPTAPPPVSMSIALRKELEESLGSIPQTRPAHTIAYRERYAIASFCFRVTARGRAPPTNLVIS